MKKDPLRQILRARETLMPTETRVSMKLRGGGGRGENEEDNQPTNVSRGAEEVEGLSKPHGSLGKA